MTIENPMGSGITNPGMGQYQHPDGTLIEITAIPSEGWRFDHWVLDDSSSIINNPVTLKMSTTHTLKAVFIQEEFDLTIQTTGYGITNLDVGIHSYPAGSVTQVYSSAEEGWIFDHWTLDGVDEVTNPISVLMSQNHQLEASFVAVESGLIPVSNLTYSLTIQTPDGQGSTSPATGTYTYAAGAAVQVTATPVLGWQFSHWHLDGVDSGSSNPVTVTMGAAHTLKPVFTQIIYSLTIQTPDGQGSTSPATGTYTYAAGAAVQVTATPVLGWQFSHWHLDGVDSGSSNPVTVTMGAAHTLKPVFTQIIYSLTIQTPDGQGSTSPATGTYTYAAGAAVQVTATPVLGWQFSHWHLDGVDSGSSNPVTVTMGAAHTLKPVFTQIIYSLTIQTPDGQGSTSPATGTYTYAAGAAVQVTATPVLGWQFSHWHLDGVDSGSSNPVTVTMGAAHTLKPVFTQIIYSLTIQTPDGQGSTSPATGTYTYAAGAAVQVTATPVLGWQFSHWHLDGVDSGSSNPVTVTMGAAHTLKPVFTQIIYSLTIQTPDGQGSTSPATGTYTYAAGAAVQVTATPVLGWQFSHWHLDGVDSGSSNPVTVTMGAAHTLKPVFTQSSVSEGKPYVQGITLRAPDGSPLLLEGFNIFITYSLSDLQWIKNHGYNSVRVNVRWQEIEPTQGNINWSKLDTFLANCETVGLYAIIDMYQWEYSPYFSFTSGIGFPSWLVANGGYANSAAGQQAFSDDFFLKRGYGATSWAKFVGLWEKIVTRYKDNPRVWAYEVLNEPMQGAGHTNAARAAAMDRYREIVPIIRAIDPETCIILHRLDDGYNQDLNESNIVWSRSLYAYMGTTKSTIDSTLNEFVSEFNTGFEAPYIISEIGVQPDQQSIADEFLTIALNEYKVLLNGGGSGGWSYYLYTSGIQGGYQGPRNSDGSDSWVQIILEKELS